MHFSVRFVRYINSLCRRRRFLSTSVLSVTAAAVGVKLIGTPGRLKDQIVHISREENGVPSTAKIPAATNITGENRDPLLPNGELNMACQCIERDVVGPCNIEFRLLRQFIHDINYTRNNLTPEQRDKLDKILEDYIECTLDNPIYYKDKLSEEERAEEEELQKKKREKEEKKRREKAANFRDLGKDKILFLTKEENAIPSTAKIEARVTEEFRGPVLPSGEVNWSCTCIEREVIGPCNQEFREFRQFIHNNKGDPADLPIEEQKNLHSIIGRYLGCTRANPLYYKDLLKDSSDNEADADLGEIDKDLTEDSKAPRVDKKKDVISETVDSKKDKSEHKK